MSITFTICTLLIAVIAEEKITAAIKIFQEGVSFRTAANLAGIDYWDFQAELDKRGIPMLSSVSLAQKRMRRD